VRMKLWRVSPAGAFAYWRRHRTRAKGSMKLLVVIFILSVGNATANAENPCGVCNLTLSMGTDAAPTLLSSNVWQIAIS